MVGGLFLIFWAEIGECRDFQIAKGKTMSKSISGWISCCALLGLLFAQFVCSECRGSQMVKAFVSVRAAAPTIWRRSESKIDPVEFNLYRHNLAALIKTPLVINKVLDSATIQ
jgi:hypothetical protein